MSVYLQVRKHTKNFISVIWFNRLMSDGSYYCFHFIDRVSDSTFEINNYSGVKASFGTRKKLSKLIIYSHSSVFRFLIPVHNPQRMKNLGKIFVCSEHVSIYFSCHSSINVQYNIFCLLLTFCTYYR